MGIQVEIVHVNSSPQTVRQQLPKMDFTEYDNHQLDETLSKKLQRVLRGIRAAANAGWLVSYTALGGECMYLHGIRTAEDYKHSEACSGILT